MRTNRVPASRKNGSNLVSVRGRQQEIAASLDETSVSSEHSPSKPRTSNSAGNWERHNMPRAPCISAAQSLPTAVSVHSPRPVVMQPVGRIAVCLITLSLKTDSVLVPMYPPRSLDVPLSGVEQMQGQAPSSHRSSMSISSERAYTIKSIENDVDVREPAHRRVTRRVQ
ncbi:unnamed protein product [Alternaria alternata]